MNITQAIRTAHERVGQLYQCGTKQYGHQTWDEKRQAWWLPQGRPYREAVAARRDALAFEALVELGFDGEDAYWATHDAYGSVRDVVKRALDRSRDHEL